MNCPNCGVDTEVYLQEKIKRQGIANAKAQKEKEFEASVWPVLKLIRRKRARIGGITGAILTVSTYLALEWLIISFALGGITKSYEILKMAPWQFSIFVVLLPTLAVTFIGALSGRATMSVRGEQEKNLRKSFGL